MIIDVGYGWEIEIWFHDFCDSVAMINYRGMFVWWTKVGEA